MSTPSDEFSVPQVPGMPGESTDDDILENTKPNLISFSLSTTSSSFNTSPRSKVNIGIGDKEPCNKTYMTDKSNDMKNVNTGFGIDGNFTLEKPRSEVEFASALGCNIYSESSHHLMLQRRNQSSNEINSASSVPDLFNLFVDENNRKQTQRSLPQSKGFSLNTCTDVLGKSRSLSMHNLNDMVNNSSSDLVHMASNPHVNKKSKTHFVCQSLKNFTVRNKSHSYSHIDSKVKHYTQCLKKNERCQLDRNSSQLEDTNSVLSQSNKHSIVSQLQLEIKELYEHLEERDKILKEVQANHHLLLLQYADAQNRLDELRVSSTAQRCIKSVQTESFLEGVNVTNLVNIQSTVSRHSNIQDSNEGKHHGNTVQSDVYDSQTDDIVSECDYRFQQLKDSQSEFESNNSSCNENEMNVTSNAYVKVSEWCTTLPNQPLPVPSCYGSLGSSGNLSLKHKEGSRFTSEILMQSSTNCIVKDLTTNTKLGLSNVSADLKHYPDTCVKFRNPLEVTLHKHFIDNLMPIENCTCLECNKFSPETQNTAAEVEKSLNLLYIPPLNLSDSLDSTYVCCSESCGDYKVLGEKPKCKLLTSEKQDVNVQSANTKYLPVKEENLINSENFDTPTSYRSILVKSDVAKEVICNHCSADCPIAQVNQCDRRRQFEKLTENFSSVNKEEGRQKNSKGVESHRFEDHSIPRISNYQQFPEFQKTMPDLLQYLHNITLCAQDLKRKTEVIQGFLTSLLESISDD